MKTDDRCLPYAEEMNAAGTGPAKPLENGPFVGPVPKS